MSMPRRCQLRVQPRERDVGDRVFVADELAAFEALIEDAVQTVGLVEEAGYRVGQFLAGIVAEVVVVAEDRPDIGDLPDEPLLDGDPPALIIGGVEAGRTSVRDRGGSPPNSKTEIGLPPGPSGSTIAGMRLLGETARKSGENCSPRPILMK